RDRSVAVMTKQGSQTCGRHPNATPQPATWMDSEEGLTGRDKHCCGAAWQAAADWQSAGPRGYPLRLHREAAVANRRAGCQLAPHSGKPQTEHRGGMTRRRGGRMPPRLGAWQPGRPLHGRRPRAKENRRGARRNEWIVVHHASDSTFMSSTRHPAALPGANGQPLPYLARPPKLWQDWRRLQHRLGWRMMALCRNHYRNLTQTFAYLIHPWPAR